MSIQKQEQLLFCEWKLALKKRDVLGDFVSDGIINEKIYFERRPRIVFLMKETNKLDKPLCKLLRKNPPGKTWNNVARWTWGLRNVWNNSDSSWDSVPHMSLDNRRDQLEQIAVINVKKTAGESFSSYSNIKKFLENDSCFIKQQIDLYTPDIVICCGDGVEYTWNEPERMSAADNPWIGRDGNRLVISYFHPGKRSSAQELYTTLVEEAAITILQLRR